MKVTLNEIKKNLQEANCGVDEAKNQINDLEHREEKNIQLEQQDGKKYKKPTKQGQAEEPLKQPQMHQYLNHGCAVRRRKRARN